MIRRRRPGWSRRTFVDLSEYAYPPAEPPRAPILARLVLLGLLALGILVASGTIR